MIQQICHFSKVEYGCCVTMQTSSHSLRPKVSKKVEHLGYQSGNRTRMVYESRNDNGFFSVRREPVASTATSHKCQD
jgi:hypothetical protein